MRIFLYMRISIPIFIICVYVYITCYLDIMCMYILRTYSCIYTQRDRDLIAHMLCHNNRDLTQQDILPQSVVDDRTITPPLVNLVAICMIACLYVWCSAWCCGWWGGILLLLGTFMPYQSTAQQIIRVRNAYTSLFRNGAG